MYIPTLLKMTTNVFAIYFHQRPPVFVWLHAHLKVETIKSITLLK